MNIPDDKTGVVSDLVQADREEVCVCRREAKSIARTRIPSRKRNGGTVASVPRGFEAQEVDATITESYGQEVIQDRIRRPSEALHEEQGKHAAVLNLNWCLGKISTCMLTFI